MGILIDFIKSPKLIIPGVILIMLGVISWQHHSNTVLKTDNLYLKSQVASVTAQFNQYKRETETANQIAEEAEAKKTESTKASNETENIITQAVTINHCFASSAPNTVIEQLRKLATSANHGK